MDRSDRTAEATTSNGAFNVQVWLTEHSGKHKSGLYTEQELSVIRALREADAAHPSRLCPKSELPPELLQHYDSSTFNDWRELFLIDEHGTLLKRRKVQGQVTWHPVCPLEKVEEVLETAHSVLTAHRSCC